MRIRRVSASIGVLGVLALVVVMTTSSRPAFADDPSCIQAYEQTQTLRRAGKLRDARAEAAKCAVESCPAVLSRDCGRWIGELEQSIPTVVFEVKSASGEELTNVKITADGKPLVEKLDGKSVVVDVGPHTFRYEPTSTDAKGGQPLDQKIVIHEGDHNRKISVTLAAAAVGDDRPIPTMVYIFGGAAVVSLGIGTIFAISGLSKEGDLDQCKPACSADAVNSVSTSYAFADILLTAGVVAGIAAAYAYFTRPAASHGTGTTATAARVGNPLRRAGFEF